MIKTYPQKFANSPPTSIDFQDGIYTDSGYPVGEGSVEGTEGYAKRIKSYLRNADVEKDGTDAAPDYVAEASEMVGAETAAAGRSRAPGK